MITTIENIINKNIDAATEVTVEVDAKDVSIESNDGRFYRGRISNRSGILTIFAPERPLFNYLTEKECSKHLRHYNEARNNGAKLLLHGTVAREGRFVPPNPACLVVSSVEYKTE